MLFFEKFYKLKVYFIGMGKIIDILNKSNDKFAVKVEFDKKYFDNLRGNLNKVNLFSVEVFEYNSRVVSSGKNNSSKYFLIPNQISYEVFAREDISYSVIEDNLNLIFIFAVNKY